jgi:hypothetical protein
MGRIKGNNTSLARMPQNRNSYTLLLGLQISTATLESSKEIPQKAKSRTAIYDPVILLLDIYPRELKSG